jgi:hypothetical protein
MTGGDAKAAVLGFVRAFERGDVAALGEFLDDDFVGHITTADGGVRDVKRSQYLDAIRAMDVPSASLRLDVPNTVEVGPGSILLMVEVHAQRNGAVLHNYSGQLAKIVDGRLRELWMVEALPAESDRFWS